MHRAFRMHACMQILSMFNHADRQYKAVHAGYISIFASLYFDRSIVVRIPSPLRGLGLQEDGCTRFCPD